MTKKPSLKPDGVKTGTSVAKGRKTKIMPTYEPSPSAMERWRAVEESKVNRMMQTARFMPKKVKP